MSHRENLRLGSGEATGEGTISVGVDTQVSIDKVMHRNLGLALCGNVRVPTEDRTGHWSRYKQGSSETPIYWRWPYCEITTKNSSSWEVSHPEPQDQATCAVYGRTREVELPKSFGG